MLSVEVKQALKHSLSSHMYLFLAPEEGLCFVFEGRLQSSWINLITQSRNFVEVR
jgi:hypothetical protein